MSNQEYYLGQCKFCGKITALKNDKCAECYDVIDLPDFLKDFLKEKK